MHAEAVFFNLPYPLIYSFLSLINCLHVAYVLETRGRTKLSSVFQGSDEELMAHSEDEHEVDAGANKG